MVNMYSDEKTWEAHFNDWVKIDRDAREPSKWSEITPEQHAYRMRLIRNLIKDYEAYHRKL